jgi:hypothetical protein
MAASGRLCSLIPGLGIKLSMMILAGTNAAFPVGGASAAIATAFAQCPLAKDEQKAGGNR